MSESMVVTEAVAPAMEGQRLDRFVAMLGDLSRGAAAEAIKDGRVTLDGVVATKASLRLGTGSEVSVEIEERDDRLASDPSVHVPVLYADDDVIVVDKPAGLVVHPGAGTRSGTVVQGLLVDYPELAEIGPDRERPGVVHRLDKGTSGVMMFARSENAYDELTAQLAARTVERRYLTLAWGSLEANEGLIDAPLGRSPREATRQAVVAGGREARTHYHVAERLESGVVTLLWCRLETGRTHQIRVHLEAIEHPVVGDDRYGPKRPHDPQLPASLQSLGRPFLHAAHLGFSHPRTDEHLAFDSPLPEDLTEVCRDLAIDPGI